MLGGYLVALVAPAFWQKRAARTVPRHAPRTGHIGLAGSVILMLASIIWLNVRQAGYLGGGGLRPPHNPPPPPHPPPPAPPSPPPPPPHGG